MQVKWQNKKKDGNFSADGIKSASEWAEEQKNKMRGKTQKADGGESSDSTDKDDYKDKILKSINEKLNRGDRLTPSEKRYLQQKDPQAYQKVLDVEREQVFYESQLRRCRTKDEFHKLRMLRTVSSLSAIKSAQNNSSLSSDDKLAVAAGEQQKNSTGATGSLPRRSGTFSRKTRRRTKRSLTWKESRSFMRVSSDGAGQRTSSTS